MGRVTKEVWAEVRGETANLRVTAEDFGFDELMRGFRGMIRDDAVLSMGVQFPDRTYEDGVEVGLVAMAHEFGVPSKNISRSRFIRGTWEYNERKYMRIVSEELDKAIAGRKKISTRSIFLQLGPIVGKDMKESVNMHNLIDTGLLLRSVGWRIERKGK